jgi:hypothetical protein
MSKPDSQQRGLAGEYYVAFTLSRLGYDIAITIARAKIIDMMASGISGKTIRIQVKSTYVGYDWLVPDVLDSSKDYIVALVRLGKNPAQPPELYLLPGVKANELITHKYVKHSARISRAAVMKKYQDHDLRLIDKLLEG